jgi:hypothetical protein
MLGPHRSIAVSEICEIACSRPRSSARDGPLGKQRRVKASVAEFIFLIFISLHIAAAAANWMPSVSPEINHSEMKKIS